MNETKQNTHEAAPSQQPAARVYRGKEVLTQDTCDYSTVQIGDYVAPPVSRWASPIPTARTLIRASGVPLTPPSSGVWMRPASGNTAATVSRGRLWSGAKTLCIAD